MNSKTKVFKCNSCGSYNEVKQRNEQDVQTRHLPEGLESFLIDFTVDLLKKNPSNLNEMNHHAHDYFNHKVNLNNHLDKKQANQVIPS